MKLKKNIAVSESGFLFDPGTGESYSLNKTGKFIVRLLSEGKNASEVEKAVMEEYEIDSDVFNRYFDDFTLMLSQYKLIEKEEA